MRNIIYYISKRFDKLYKQHPKTLKDWREKNYIESKFLNNIFANDREMFLDLEYKTNLQKGRARSVLNSYYDSTNISYAQHIERWFLHGWWYEEHSLKDGSVYKALYSQCGSSRGCTNETSLKYAKYLTEKYGKELFVRVKAA